MSLRDRAGAAGIGAPTVAAILDLAPSSAYRMLDGELPGRQVEAIIAAWEIMSAEQRRQWLDALGVLAERPRRGRPRKAQ